VSRPAPYLRIINREPGAEEPVHGLANDEQHTACGLEVAEHDLEGWEEQPAGEPVCAECLDAGAVDEPAEDAAA